jgi:hypothetical protein
VRLTEGPASTGGSWAKGMRRLRLRYAVRKDEDKDDTDDGHEVREEFVERRKDFRAEEFT